MLRSSGKQLKGEQMSKNSLKKYEDSLSFISFGSSRSVIPLCPAGGGDTQGFCLEMIAVLVGTMIEGFEEHGWDLRGQDSATPPHLDTLLRSKCDDYGMGACSWLVSVELSSWCAQCSEFRQREGRVCCDRAAT